MFPKQTDAFRKQAKPVKQTREGGPEASKAGRGRGPGSVGQIELEMKYGIGDESFKVKFRMTFHSIFELET